MRYSVTTNSYHGFSLEDALQGIAAAGFRYAELAAMSFWTQHVSPGMTAEEKGEARDLLAKYGLRAVGMSGHVNMMDPASREELAANLELAAYFGCGTLVTGCGDAGEGRFTEKDLLANIRAALPLLEEKNIRLSLENQGAYGSGASLLPVVREAGSPLVGICYDSANCFYYTGIRPEEDFPGCAEAVNYIHIKDHRGAHSAFDFPGAGNGDLGLRKFLECVRAAGYDGDLVVEAEYTEEFALREKRPEDLPFVNREIADAAAFLRGI